MMRAIARKRQIVEQANRATLSARRTGGKERSREIDDGGFGTLRGVDSRVPVAGEE
jgi:hypothetical protein